MIKDDYKIEIEIKKNVIETLLLHQPANGPFISDLANELIWLLVPEIKKDLIEIIAKYIKDKGNDNE